MSVEPVTIGNATLYCGDALTVLLSMESKSVQCVVTSPPYFGLRDYGHDGQIGLEETPQEYVAALVAVFWEVRRVLRDDGTVWVNLGDSYNAYNGGAGPSSNLSKGAQTTERPNLPSGYGLKVKSSKPKELLGIPWRVAFALQDDGWYLRQDIIWHKPNPMPESVTDRCTKAHEYVFLLTKSPRYYYDSDSIKEPCKPDTGPRYERGRSDNHKWADGGPGNQTIARGFEHMSKSGNKARRSGAERGCPEGSNSNVCSSVPWEGSTANKRSVWTITTRPYRGAHFATFPPELPRLCIAAGTKPGDVVLDPFAGAGTTGVVAVEMDRKFIGIEISETYMNELMVPRIEDAQRQGRLAI